MVPVYVASREHLKADIYWRSIVDYPHARRKLVEWVREQMMGTATPDNILNMSPLERYPCGVLFPVITGEEGLDPADEIQDEDDEYINLTDDKHEEKAQPIVRRRYIPPSSVGFSFFVPGNDWCFRVEFSAVRYKRFGGRDDSGRYTATQYERISLADDKSFIEDVREAGRFDVMEGRAGIDVQARPYASGQIITVSLFNKQKLGDPGKSIPDWQQERCEKSLFEVKLRCHMDFCEIANYPQVEYSLLSEEEQELELRYQNRKIYAVGHGAAADWKEKDGVVREIFSDFMPTVEVPQVTVDTSGQENQVLDIEYLSTLPGNPSSVCDKLQEFVADYKNWVIERQKETEQLKNLKLEAGKRITDRMQCAVERMQAGISLLRSDDCAARSFALANKAMLDQMRQSARINKKDESKNYRKNYRWRPFQLAFLLTTIESTIDGENKYRDTVDLIWFPTGGGKTEAYLGLIAYLVVWRRLRFPDTGGGTTALMRYTLRLLTAQQYTRAARMICALELIRKKEAPDLGKEAITVGLWVGEAASPNGFKQALEFVNKGDEDSLKSLVLDKCPWCGENFTASNYQATPDSFNFLCRNEKCDFYSEYIPCNVVDEALYKSPPTLLIATIDKFARFAWEERANGFLGSNKYHPPGLVIQDELHLISGALGSIAGLYETALQTVLANRGLYPKYIASTATIRMADNQVRRLYGNNVAVFPPPGLDCDNSYFARTVSTEEQPGRLYVGYHAPSLDRQHCMTPLATALLMAPETIFEPQLADRDDWLDAWWTQIVYHGSLKGVGNSHNAFDGNVQERYERLQKVEETTAPFTRPPLKIAQLTSNVGAREIAQIFARLQHNRTTNDSLDVVLATNMVSVGLDVARLALMIINGQPLTTAEYIQASSRVGRGLPGIVFINYYRDQARSISHYENFRPYHESFYRFVEATSITPFTYQARTRALHAALVIAIRHSCPHLLANAQKAGEFKPESDDKVRKVVEMLKRRCGKADSTRSGEIAAHLDRLVKEWHDQVLQAENEQCQLDYSGKDNDRANERLLYNHTDKNKGLWPTLQSMRNVENSAVLKIENNINKQKYIPVRLSHLLRHSSVGAIIRGPEYLMTVKDIRNWKQRDGSESGSIIPYVEQVKSVLDIKQELRQPPDARILDRDKGVVDGSWIPARLFPAWMQCPSCHLLYYKPWKNSDKATSPKCRSCDKRSELKQVHWVLIHEDGHMADLPWHFLAHSQANRPGQKQCRWDTSEAYLQLRPVQGGKRELFCKRCNTRTPFNNAGRWSFAGTWRQPWLPEPAETSDDKPGVVMEINDARVHAAVVRTALVIPPESRIRKGSVVDRLYSRSDMRTEIEMAKQGLPRRQAIARIAKQLHCSKQEIEEARKKIDKGYPLYGENITKGKLLESEYEALTQEIPDMQEDEDFVTEHITREWQRLRSNFATSSRTRMVLECVDQVIAVKRVKEIMVMQGFQRMGGEVVPPDIIGTSDWLPAIELYGEGIFFTLKESILQHWESGTAVCKRAGDFDESYQKLEHKFEPEITVNPRFLLLHTMSHILVRELEAEAGYPAASLKERIYCGTGKMPMSGILIYVAVPDVAGSLGGLVELADPDRFLRLMSQVFDRSEWCSMDPVCSEHEGHGPNLLNRAACHTCTLVPETSCAYGNMLMDRVFLKGSERDGITSFLDSARSCA